MLAYELDRRGEIALHSDKKTLNDSLHAHVTPGEALRMILTMQDLFQEDL